MRRTAIILASLVLATGLAAPAQAELVEPAPAVPVELQVASTSETVTATAPVKVKTASGPDAARIGTCSGSYRTVTRTQYFKNLYGAALAHTVQRTTFYWNGTRVTCSYTSKNAYVDTYGALGGWYFVNWTDSGEVFYAYNGRTNGGSKSWAVAYFRLCLNLTARTACVDTATTTTRIYGHYDGTWTASGGTS